MLDLLITPILWIVAGAALVVIGSSLAEALGRGRCILADLEQSGAPRRSAINPRPTPRA